jgi:hypothetical protein
MLFTNYTNDVVEAGLDYIVPLRKGEDLAGAFIRPLHEHKVPNALEALYGRGGQQGFEAPHRRPPRGV